VPLSNSAVFELAGARVVIGARVVLDEVDFRLDQGEFVALLGDNGAGKTTLVRVLLRLVGLQRGTLTVFGESPNRFSGWHRIGYVPQRFSASGNLPANVEEVVLSGRAGRTQLHPWYSKADRKMAAKALASVGLEERAKELLASLSGGQQQRVLIARALATEPDLLILDEPAAGIDQESQKALAATLQELNEKGNSVLLVAHGLGEMQGQIHRTVVLEAGRVVYDGSPVAKSAFGDHLHVHHHPGEEGLGPERAARESIF